LGENPESEHDAALESELPRLGLASPSHLALLEVLGKARRRLPAPFR